MWKPGFPWQRGGRWLGVHSDGCPTNTAFTQQSEHTRTKIIFYTLYISSISDHTRYSHHTYAYTQVPFISTALRHPNNHRFKVTVIVDSLYQGIIGVMSSRKAIGRGNHKTPFARLPDSLLHSATFWYPERPPLRTARRTIQAWPWKYPERVLLERWLGVRCGESPEAPKRVSCWKSEGVAGEHVRREQNKMRITMP